MSKDRIGTGNQRLQGAIRPIETGGRRYKTPSFFVPYRQVNYITSKKVYLNFHNTAKFSPILCLFSKFICIFAA